MFGTGPRPVYKQMIVVSKGNPNAVSVGSLVIKPRSVGAEKGPTPNRSAQILCLKFYPWTVDSATTSHITYDKSVFIEYTPIKPILVKGLGNNTVPAYGRGTIEILTSASHDARTILLYNVLYVPDTQDNLLSIARVDKAGGQVRFSHGKAFLLDNNEQLIAEAPAINRLYVLNFFRKTDPKERSNIAHPTQNNSWTEWHKRFGHVGISGLKRLKQANLVNGFDIGSTFI